jgi:hypothetical protein
MTDDTLLHALDAVIRELPTREGYRSVSASWSVNGEPVTLTLSVADLDDEATS